MGGWGVLEEGAGPVRLRDRVTGCVCPLGRWRDVDLPSLGGRRACETGSAGLAGDLPRTCVTCLAGAPRPRQAALGEICRGCARARDTLQAEHTCKAAAASDVGNW